MADKWTPDLPSSLVCKYSRSGADPGFQVRGGAHLKKLRRAKGGANIFGVFRVKNHDLMSICFLFQF